jgi:hypothetical protein
MRDTLPKRIPVVDDDPSLCNILPTPVILLTGWGQWFENPGGTPLPVNCIPDKPPELRELREALTRCLNSKT